MPNNDFDNIRGYKELKAHYDLVQEYSLCLPKIAQMMQQTQIEKGYDVSVESIALLPFSLNEPLSPEQVSANYEFLDKRKDYMLKLTNNCRKLLLEDLVVSKEKIKPLFSSVFEQMFPRAPEALNEAAYGVFFVYFESGLSLERNLSIVKKTVVANIRALIIPSEAVTATETLTKQQKI